MGSVTRSAETRQPKRNNNSSHDDPTTADKSNNTNSIVNNATSSHDPDVEFIPPPSSTTISNTKLKKDCASSSSSSNRTSAVNSSNHRIETNTQQTKKKDDWETLPQSSTSNSSMAQKSATNPYQQPQKQATFSSVLSGRWNSFIRNFGAKQQVDEFSSGYTSDAAADFAQKPNDSRLSQGPTPSTSSSSSRWQSSRPSLPPMPTLSKDTSHAARSTYQTSWNNNQNMSLREEDESYSAMNQIRSNLTRKASTVTIDLLDDTDAEDDNGVSSTAGGGAASVPTVFTGYKGDALIDTRRFPQLTCYDWIRHNEWCHSLCQMVQSEPGWHCYYVPKYEFLKDGPFIIEPKNVLHLLPPNYTPESTLDFAALYINDHFSFPPEWSFETFKQQPEEKEPVVENVINALKRPGDGNDTADGDAAKKRRADRRSAPPGGIQQHSPRQQHASTAAAADAESSPPTAVAVENIADNNNNDADDDDDIEIITVKETKQLKTDEKIVKKPSTPPPHIDTKAVARISPQGTGACSIFYASNYCDKNEAAVVNASPLDAYMHPISTASTDKHVLDTLSKYADELRWYKSHSESSTGRQQQQNQSVTLPPPLQQISIAVQTNVDRRPPLGPKPGTGRGQQTLPYANAALGLKTSNNQAMSTQATENVDKWIDVDTNCDMKTDAGTTFNHGYPDLSKIVNIAPPSSNYGFPPESRNLPNDDRSAHEVDFYSSSFRVNNEILKTVQVNEHEHRPPPPPVPPRIGQGRGRQQENFSPNAGFIGNGCYVPTTGECGMMNNRFVRMPHQPPSYHNSVNVFNQGFREQQRQQQQPIHQQPQSSRHNSRNSLPPQQQQHHDRPLNDVRRALKELESVVNGVGRMRINEQSGGGLQRNSPTPSSSSRRTRSSMQSSPSPPEAVQPNSPQPSSSVYDAAAASHNTDAAAATSSTNQPMEVDGADDNDAGSRVERVNSVEEINVEDGDTTPKKSNSQKNSPKPTRKIAACDKTSAACDSSTSPSKTRSAAAVAPKIIPKIIPPVDMLPGSDSFTPPLAEREPVDWNKVREHRQFYCVSASLTNIAMTVVRNESNEPLHKRYLKMLTEQIKTLKTHVNIFSLMGLFMPFCIDSHYILLVIVNPNFFAACSILHSQKRAVALRVASQIVKLDGRHFRHLLEDRETAPNFDLQPCLIYLDSMHSVLTGGRKKEAEKCALKVLEIAWKAEGNDKSLYEIDWFCDNPPIMQTFSCKPPQQVDSFNCGLFVIYFAERLMLNFFKTLITTKENAEQEIRASVKQLLDPIDGRQLKNLRTLWLRRIFDVRSYCARDHVHALNMPVIDDAAKVQYADDFMPPTETPCDPLALDQYFKTLGIWPTTTAKKESDDVNDISDDEEEVKIPSCGSGVASASINFARTSIRNRRKNKKPGPEFIETGFYSKKI